MVFGQHDAEWIEAGSPGEDNILIFNNGSQIAGRAYSSVDEIEPPLQADGSYATAANQAYGPDNLVWSYTADPVTNFFADHISGSQRLANGNTLITDGTGGKLFEVAASGEVVWRYEVGSHVFRADRYAPEYSGFDGTSLDDDSGIYGYVWNDANVDQFWNVGEDALEGRGVYIDANGNGQPDAGEPTDVTDATGHYEIGGLTPGTYSIAQVTENGWVQSWPAGPDPSQSVTLTAENAWVQTYFGNYSDTSNNDPYTIQQTLSDQAQKTTIAFDGLAFLTGTLGADSFLPPGKVADFWGFQYLRDNDPSEMGHNTDFLTRAANNVLHILSDSQISELVALAESQIDSIDQYAYDRFTLMDAFRRLLEGDLPDGSTGLDADAVTAYSAELYQLDGEISLQRAKVMGGILHGLTDTQRDYLDAMAGKGMTSWPDIKDQIDPSTMNRDLHVAVMTYAADLLSWYVGSVESDVYFCPERQATYFGSFYLKDAPAMGNPNYTIDSNLTANMGNAFLATLTAKHGPPSPSRKEKAFPFTGMGASANRPSESDVVAAGCSRGP